MRVVMLGPPGSGKGTQGEVLAAALGVPHIVSSELLSRHVEHGTPLGRRAHERMAAGELVEDEIVDGMVRERLAEPDAAGGFVLDGFPRSTAQAEALTGWLAEDGARLDAVVLLEVPRDALIERIRARALAEHRIDDDPVTVAHRLSVYDAETAPLAEYYERERVLLAVDGDGAVDAVAQRVAAAVSGIDTATTAG